jgi:hypothetical protein
LPARSTALWYDTSQAMDSGAGPRQVEPPSGGAPLTRCQECIDLLIDYLEGELPPARARALELHLDLCPPCVRFVRTYQGTVDVARSLPVDDIPPELTQRLIEFLTQEQNASLPRHDGR